MHSPWGGATGPEAARSRAASAAPTCSGGQAPEPTPPSVPTTLRPWLCGARRARKCHRRPGAPAAGEARPPRHGTRRTRAGRRPGCLPRRRVFPGHGSSLHDAGQFPATEEERPLTTTPSGRLRGTRSVYLADGSVLAYLPAKGLTFTLMANADRIGSGIARGLA